MKGKSIVVSAAPRGVYLNGVSAVALTPGQLVDISAVDSEGNYTFQLAAPGGNGHRGFFGVVDLPYQGGVYSDSIPAGDQVRVYVPIKGDQLNVRVKTAEVIAVGGKLILENSSGYVLATTGTVEEEPLVALEALTSAANEPAHVIVS